MMQRQCLTGRRDFLASVAAGATLAAVAPSTLAGAAGRKLVKSNLIHLGINMWGDDPAPTGEAPADSRTWPQDPTVARNPAWLTGCADYLRFDEDVYRKVIDRMAEKGLNQVVIDVGEIFGTPRLFHLGMDEERYEVQKNYNVVIVRNAEQWWHDVRWMVALCERLGMRPWLLRGECGRTRAVARGAPAACARARLPDGAVASVREVLRGVPAARRRSRGGGDERMNYRLCPSIQSVQSVKSVVKNTVRKTL